jgi:hypothetical protein
VTDVEPGDILVVDMESPPRGSGDLSGWCLEWLYHVEARAGVRPWVYTGKWYAADARRLTDPALGNYPLWTAAYGPTPPAPYAPWLQVTLWQHTDGASYPGIGVCDESLFTGSVEQLPTLGRSGTAQFVMTTAQHLRAKSDAWSTRGELLAVGATVTGTGPITPHWRAVRAANGQTGWVLKSNIAAAPPALPQQKYVVRSQPPKA